jgi:hypothetical protein
MLPVGQSPTRKGPSESIIKNEIVTTAAPESAGMGFFKTFTPWKEKMSLSEMLAGLTKF